MVGSDDNDRRGGNRAAWNWYFAERGEISPDAHGTTTFAEMIGSRLQALYPVAPTEAPEAIDSLLAKLAAKGI